MRFSILLVIFTVTMIGASCGFYAYLNISKLKTDLATLESMRYSVIASSVSDAAEQGLRFGLLIDQIDNMNTLLNRVKERHGEIRAAAVVSDTCEVLFGDKSLLPPAGTLCTLRDRQGVRQYADGRFAFREIVNSFDRAVGSVVLLYPDNLLDQAIGTATDELIEATFVVLAIACGIAMIGILLVIRPATRGFSHLANALGTAQVTPVPGLDVNLTRPLADRQSRIAEVRADLDEIDHLMQEA